MSADKFFFENPIFRSEEFIAWKVSLGTTNPLSIKSALKYYIKTGKIARLHQNVFGVIPPNETQDTLNMDPFLLASKVTRDSVLAYHTALEFHGVAYSSFEQFIFLSSQKVKPFYYQGRQFQPAALPTRLTRNHQEGMEVQIVNRQGIEVKVTTLERTFVDVIHRVEICGGWEEISRSLENIAVLNIENTINYCLKYNSSILSAKVGFFLEKRKGAFTVSDKELAPLLKVKPISPQYLGKKNQEKCRLVKKWNLMMPENLLEQTWEEPNHDF